MSIVLKNNLPNNIKMVKPVLTEIGDTPNDTINITPILNYIKELSPSHIKSAKGSSNVYYSPRKINRIYDNSALINQTYFDINKLTINHNTNLTNLNLYFLYNSEKSDPIKNGKINFHNVKHIYEREPIDTVRKNLGNTKKNPKDKDIPRENKFKRYHSIRYQIKRVYSKSPLNNTESFFNKSKKKNSKSKTKKKNKLNEINEIKETNEKSPIHEKKNEPKGKLNLSEFTQISQIGKGTFGKIYSVKWKKNGKKYAIKKEVFNDLEYVQKRQNIIKIINDFLTKTKNKGVIEIYSNLCEKNKEDEYNYYELMEIGERDLEKEINDRRNNNLYYSEKELINIATQLIKTLSLLQKNHITHRDIKPQNILYVNGFYKLCDFGEIRIMKREGIVVQRIRGSELYMSPILFYGLRANMIQVRHNTYKSDVFSLGMCLLYAATMYFNCTDEIREMTDMDVIKKILKKYLSDKYSNKFISLIHLMLQIDEQLRPDFIQLEEKLNNLLIV